MENKSISIQISCPLHPSENIQRVSMDTYTDHHLYCLECILTQNGEGTKPQTLKPFSELVDAAATLYTNKRDITNFGEQIPFEMAEILSGQAEKLERLTQHIEQEKKRVSSVFESLSEEFLKTLEQKKTKTLYKLDQQIFNLRFWYISFDKQLKKTFPTPEDIPILYPTKEELQTKLGKIANATQLTALVKSLKEDLNEAASIGENERTLEVKKKTSIHQMSKELLKVVEKRPSYQGEDFDLEKLKEKLREKLSDLMKEAWDIKDFIGEVSTGSHPHSFLIKENDFDKIKSWLPQNLHFSPKLLFRGSRDGMTAQDFHRRCDHKTHTITVIKATFAGASQPTIIGGYFDQAWNSLNSPNGFLYSDVAFLFSISKSLKFPLKKTGNAEQMAGMANQNQGPSFGGGHDLGVWVNGSSYVYPYSYENSSQLIESSNNIGGQTFIDVLDVEVYSVN